MNKLPTAAEVRRVVIDLNGFGEYLTANGRKGDGLIAEAVWLLESFVELVGLCVERLGALDRALEHHDGPPQKHAEHMRAEVRPAMADLREVVDELEQRVADDLWPLPRYREMLLIK